MKTKVLPFFKLASVLLLFFLFFPSIVSAQDYYNLNGRNLVRISGAFYDITDLDTLSVDENLISIKFNDGLSEQNKQAVISNYPCTFMGVLVGDYYVVSPNSNIDYVTFVNNLNLNSSIFKTYLSYSVPYCTELHNNDPANYYNTWYQGFYDDSGIVPELEYFDLPDAWGTSTGSSDVLIGIIDSGCDWSQQDFPADNHLGINYSVVPPSIITYPNYSNSNLFQPHGTSVFSVISSKTNNGIGIFGIAGGWDNVGGGTPIVIVNQEINSNDASWTATALGIRYAVDKHARIINLTIGAYPEYMNVDDVSRMTAAIDYATQNDVIVVCSAGNYITSPHPLRHDVTFPASYGPVIAVGGVDEFYDHFTKGSYSSCYGTGLDFVAPGEDIWTNPGTIVQGVPNYISDGYGTSLAAPMVTGIISLMLSVNPCLKPNQVYDILKQSCYKPGQYSYNTDGWALEVGYGFINAYKAVELAKGFPSITIQGDVTWSSDRQYNGNITIASGGKLTLDGMTLQMNDNSRIFISTGAELIVTNSTITSACIPQNGFWEGIIVDGNSTMTQIPYWNQGKVTLNNSTISNAKTGIKAYLDLDDRLSIGHGGGIVNATNTYFINNQKAIYLGPYNFASQSQFKYCHFVIDDSYHGGNIGVSQIFAHLDNINNVFFSACEFINMQTDDINKYKGIGLETLNSNFITKGICTGNPQPDPCPDNLFDKTEFIGLGYGIRALNSGSIGKTSITHTFFSDNNCGLYFSNLNYADLLTNYFFVPGFQDPDPRGAYIEGSTGFHIENNWFEGLAPHNKTDEIGLYILNIGGAQNYVYNNYFANLNRGAVADGANRSSGGSTGLCYKCNTFDGVSGDIDIQRDNTPLTTYHGIALNQGSPLITSSNQQDTLAAGNIFSANSSFSIRNINNWSNYYYHRFTNPQNLKVIPDPVTINTILRFPVGATTYSKLLSCKSWINSGSIPIESLLADKSVASSESQSAETILLNTIDDGNTANLASDVLASSPPEAIALRDELMQKSPYLSDSVMKTAIDKENVLNNSMIRDILVENPHSAKSDEIMEKLDNRFDPMPQYMKDEIAEGKNIVCDKEILEAKRDNWLQKESYLFGRIVAAYMSDTVSTTANTDLKNFLQTENNLLATYTLTELYLNEGNFSAASQALNNFQNNNSISATDQEEIAGYNTLISILTNLHADSILLTQLDSAHATPVIMLYNSGETRAAIYARNILIASGIIHYVEPINGSDITKSAEASNEESTQKKTDRIMDELLRIYPNPATFYFTADYHTLEKPSKVTLVIRDSKGVVKLEQALTKDRDQTIIDTKSFTSGDYIVTLMANGKNICSKAITIIR